MVSNLSRWPALDPLGTELPGRLTVHRAVWGKQHGSSSDYRWLAATPPFLAEHQGIARAVTLGPEDAPRRSVSWSANDETCFGIVSYPSSARDASMRAGFIEKQFLAWHRPAAVPAALGALALLPGLYESADDTRWSRQPAPDSRTAEPAQALTPESFDLDDEQLAATLERGIAQLESSFGREALIEIIASMLLDHRGLPVGRDLSMLEPESIAALLAVLPRPQADRISIAGAYLSSRGLAKTASSWHLVAGAPWPPPDPLPHNPQVEDAARRVDALLSRRPEALSASTVSSSMSTPSDNVDIALWGPSSAGKTVLIAQLYLFIEESKNGDWEVFPDQTSVGLIQERREQMHRNNLFPQATVVGTSENIVYNFVHRTRSTRASMAVEDRAGDDFETLIDDVRKRLKAARGLVLLFDPHRLSTQLEVEVAKTLEEVYVSRGDGGKDARPIAVCISKADTLIETSRDYDQAMTDGERFVRAKVDQVLVKTLDRFCTNYRLFPVSAAGIKRRHGVIEPTVFFDETLTPRLSRGGTPLNLMKPFAWVLDEVMAS